MTSARTTRTTTRQAIRPTSPQRATRVMIAMKAEAAVAVDVAAADEVATRIETRMAVRHLLPVLRPQWVANNATIAVPIGIKAAIEVVIKAAIEAAIEVATKIATKIATKVAIKIVAAIAGGTAVVSAATTATKVAATTATATATIRHRHPKPPLQPQPPLQPLLQVTSRDHQTRSPFHRSRARSTAAACANSRRASVRRAAVTSEFKRSATSTPPRIAHASATLHPRRDWLHRHKRT
jgi:hypothetical protein